MNAILLGVLVYAALRFVGTDHLTATIIATAGGLCEVLWITATRKQNKWLQK